MRVYDRESEYHGSGGVVALGMFDGVHIAHQKLLKTTVDLAARYGVESIVLTFKENPLKVLFPERAPTPLMTLDEKIERIAALGIDVMIARPFTSAFAAIEAAEYLDRLATDFKPSAIVVGYNYTFGKNGAGNPDFLRQMENVYSYKTVVVQPIALNGVPVSSTTIRALIGAGDSVGAREMLGR